MSEEAKQDVHQQYEPSPPQLPRKVISFIVKSATPDEGTVQFKEMEERGP